MTISELELLKTLARKYRQSEAAVSISAMVAASGSVTRADGVTAAKRLLDMETEGWVMFIDGGLIPTRNGMEALGESVFDEGRIDAIGQNGALGIHYDPGAVPPDGVSQTVPADSQSVVGRCERCGVTFKRPLADKTSAESCVECATQPRVGRADEPAGRKDDGGKLRMDLLFTDMPLALQEVVDVLTQGANKYAPGNWQHVPDPERRYLAAGLRHELALANGQEADPETDCHHLAHVICCNLFRLELALRGEW